MATPLTELRQDLACIIWMPTEVEKALVADILRALLLVDLEPILLHVRDGLHAEAHGEQDDASDIAGLSECWLIVANHYRRVQDGDRHGNSPHPQHLEDPKAEKGEELVPLVVKSIVLAGLEDAEKQETRKTQ